MDDIDLTLGHMIDDDARSLAIQKKVNEKKATNRNTTKDNKALNLLEVNLSDLKDNPDQPRLDYNEDTLFELAASIKQDGLLQPIGVKKLDDNSYQIEFGHRRARACKLLGMETIKAVMLNNAGAVRNNNIVALIENIQRDDMHTIDIALSITKALRQDKHLKQSDIAKAISKDKTYVNKMVKIFDLPNEVIEDLINNKTINDRVVLDNLRKIKDTKVCISIYDWYKKEKPSRKEFLKKITELNRSEEGVESKKNDYSIKKTSDYTIFELPVLNDNQIAKLKQFIDSIL